MAYCVCYVKPYVIIISADIIISSSQLASQRGIDEGQLAGLGGARPDRTLGAVRSSVGIDVKGGIRAMTQTSLDFVQKKTMFV